MIKSGRFVIQKHSKQNHPIHWDLMLEEERFLRTFRIDQPPEKCKANTAIKIKRIFDHPLKFLDYQGSVNQGKGQVQIADRGNYHVITEDEAKITIELQGQILSGRFDLVIV